VRKLRQLERERAFVVLIFDGKRLWCHTQNTSMVHAECGELLWLLLFVCDDVVVVGANCVCAAAAAAAERKVSGSLK